MLQRSGQQIFLMDWVRGARKREAKEGSRLTIRKEGLSFIEKGKTKVE